MESASPQPIRDYKDWHVWQKGMELAKQVYLLTNRFPSEEKYGLVSQVRRAAVSVPSNIAEGQARNTPGEFRDTGFEPRASKLMPTSLASNQLTTNH